MNSKAKDLKIRSFWCPHCLSDFEVSGGIKAALEDAKAHELQCEKNPLKIRAEKAEAERDSIAADLRDIRDRLTAEIAALKEAMLTKDRAHEMSVEREFKLQSVQPQRKEAR